MAMTDLRMAIRAVIHAQLAPRLRYRCLVVESPNVKVLTGLHDDAVEALREWGWKPVTVDGRDFMDSVGAMPCSIVTEKLFALAEEHSVTVLGPLHFLDYWTPQIRATFWADLAALQRGYGIILFDVPRVGDADSSFRVIAKIPGTDIRYMKSRLASTQDGLA